VKIFVTGTQSFVGRELVSRCQQDGVEVSGCDISETGDSGFHSMDIRCEGVADIIPEGVDAVVHLAALSTNQQCSNKAYDCFDVNVMGTLNLARASIRKNAKQFIFASSEWVYDSFAEGEVKTEDSAIDAQVLSTEYSLSKLVSEMNLRQQYAHGFCATTLLRFGIIYGSRLQGGSAVESLFRSVRARKDLDVGSLQTGRCFVHVSDIAEGIIKSVGLEGMNVINLQGDGLVTLGQIIKTSQKVLGNNVKVSETNPSNISVKRVSNELAGKLLGWHPKVDLEAGLTMLNECMVAADE